MTEKRSILVDTDLGLGAKNTDVDDGIAILLALASPELEVVGITTVGGNVPRDIASLNLLRLLRRIGREEIPFAPGNAEPIAGVGLKLRAKWCAVEAPAPTEEEKGTLCASQLAYGTAVDFLLKNIEALAGGLTVVALGPLTNLGLAAAIAPEIFAKVGQVVIMGGTAHLRNVPTITEFNIFCDPEAADIVFRSGVPLTMFGLDTTTMMEVGPRNIQQWQKTGGFLAYLYGSCVDYMSFRSRRYAKDHPFMYFHDVMPVAWLTDRPLFQTMPCWVDIERNGDFTRGMTVVDRDGRFHDGATPHTAACGVHPEAFQEFLLHRISHAYRNIR